MHTFLVVVVDAVVVDNGTFSWGTTGDDVEILKKYVDFMYVVRRFLYLLQNSCSIDV